MFCCAGYLRLLGERVPAQGFLRVPRLDEGEEGVPLVLGVRHLGGRADRQPAVEEEEYRG